LGVRREIRRLLREILEGAVRTSFGSGVLEPVKQAVRSWNVDVNNLSEFLGNKDLSSFTQYMLNSLRSHLSSTLGDRLGAGVILSRRNPLYPAIGPRRLNYNLGVINLPTNEIISVIMRSFEALPFNNYFQPIMEHIASVDQFRRKIEELTQKTPELIEKYSYENRHRHVEIPNWVQKPLSIYQDSMILVRPIPSVPRSVEVFIHIPGRKNRIYVFLNQRLVPLHTFSNHQNMTIFQRPLGLVLNRRFHEHELQWGVNTLWVVSIGDSGEQYNSLVTFSL
jgi:hypothetical protein